VASITWTAYEGETVDLVAGLSIPPQSWTTTTISNGGQDAYVVDLQSVLTIYGLEASEVVGSLPGPNSLGDCSKIHGIELFFNQTPMYLARYPNIASNGTWFVQTLHLSLHFVCWIIVIIDTTKLTNSPHLGYGQKLKQAARDCRLFMLVINPRTGSTKPISEYTAIGNVHLIT